MIVIRIAAREGKGSRVVGRFTSATALAPKRTRGELAKRYLVPISLIGLALTVGAIALGAKTALILPLLAILLFVPAAGIMLPLLSFWNASSREEHMESLWSLVGEVFMPVALPADPEDDPFRA